VDLGTSSVKVAVFDLQGEIKATSTNRYPIELGESGMAEQDPERWWGGVCDCLRDVLSSGSEFNIKGIGFTGQWGGTVPVDSEGNPLHKAIIWLDTRGKDVVYKLTGGFPSISGYRIDKLYTWLRKTGGAPEHSGKDSLAHILYIKQNLPDLYRETHKFMEPKDYIVMKMTGACVGSWDITTLLWATDNRDPSRVRYDDGLLKMAGLDRQKLPDLVAPSEVVGSVTSRAAEETGLPEGTKVIAGGGDNQCSPIGTGCADDYLPLLYIGTSSWITVQVPFKKTDILHNIASLPSAIPGRYFVIATQETAGNALEFMSTILNVSPQNKYEELDQMALSSPRCAKKLIFLPWLFGERAPIEDPYARGGLFNLSLAHDRNDTVRAVMEGVAYNTKWLLGVVEAFVGARRKRSEGLVMSGGGSLSRVWPQIFSDILERELTVIDNPIYSTAKGAAMLAALGTQSLTSEQLRGMKPVGRVIRPQKEGIEAYREGYRQFLQYYKNNKKSLREYNRGR
jgi:xylulokinase